VVSEEAKKLIDNLPEEELRLEVNKAHRSRFQGDNFSYVQSRLQNLERDERAAQHGAEVAALTEANEIAQKANELAVKANATATNAWRASIFSVIAALVAVIVSMCGKA
jgi:flagellin-like hook-associated protein FlgL